MRICLWISLLLCLPSSFALAATSRPAVFASPVRTKQHQKLLNKVSLQLRSVRVIRAQFLQQKYIKALTRPLIARGTFLFARSIGVYWKTLTPFPSAIVLTPKKLVEKDPKSGKTTASAGSKSLLRTLAHIFISIISVDIEQLQKMFVLHVTGTPQSWTLGLLPKRREIKRFIGYVLLQGTQTIQRVQIVESNGDSTIYTIHHIQTKPGKLSSSEQKQFR